MKHSSFQLFSRYFFCKIYWDVNLYFCIVLYEYNFLYIVWGRHLYNSKEMGNLIKSYYEKHTSFKSFTSYIFKYLHNLSVSISLSCLFPLHWCSWIRCIWEILQKFKLSYISHHMLTYSFISLSRKYMKVVLLNTK